MTKAVFLEGLLFYGICFMGGLRTELLKIYLSRKILITIAGNNSRKKHILVIRNKSYEYQTNTYQIRCICLTE
mgnify:CR=1 FL=1